MELQRTVKVKIVLTREQEAKLLALQPLLTAAYNQAAASAWNHPTLHSAVDLHHAVYYTLKATYPLPAQFICDAQRLAWGSVQSARNRLKKGKEASCPHSNCLPIPYNIRTMRLEADRKQVSLATLGKGERIAVPIKRHKHLLSYVDWQTDSGKVYQDAKGQWWLALTLTQEVVDPQKQPLNQNTALVGCDRGIVTPAALSTGELLGDPDWHEVDQTYFNRKRALQRKGSKSAKRRLKRIGRKCSRFRAWCDQNIVKQILSRLKPGSLLVLEDLSEIRQTAKRRRRREQRRLHGWSFRRQQTLLEAQAPEYGIRIEYVDPRYTSQKCSQCGHTERKNRQTQARFKCKACGYETHADYNAACNIAANWIVSQSGNPQVAARLSHVTPPIVASDKDTRNLRRDRGVRVRRVTKMHALHVSKAHPL